MSLGGYDIQFGFLNRDAHCHLCGHTGHSPDYCHVTHESKLPTIYFDDEGNPSLSSPNLEQKKRGKKNPSQSPIKQ